jgi:hypothetical protein
VINDGRCRSVQRQRAIRWNGKGEGWVVGREVHTFTKNYAMGRQKCVHIIRVGNPSPQATTYVPVLSDFCLIVETKPSWSVRWDAMRINCDDFQICGISQLQAMIVSAHVEVASSEGHVEIEAVSNMRHALRKCGCNHSNVVKFEHRGTLIPTADERACSFQILCFVDLAPLQASHVDDVGLAFLRQFCDS